MLRNFCSKRVHSDCKVSKRVSFGIEVKSGLLKKDERRDQEQLRAHKGGFRRLLRYYGRLGGGAFLEEHQ